MNDPSLVTALCSLFGTLIGSISGVLVANKLTNYRIEQLEKKLDKYAEKTDRISLEHALTKRDLETAFIRIDELKKAIIK